ncbi:hypothetical protein C6P43_004915 [Kluyveromyces marxianus]|nr:hypothetical protein C6P43_004915 [Kluyveromyces marxianus]
MVTQSSLGAFLEHAKVNKCEVSDEIEFRLDPVTGIGAFCKKPVQKVDVSLIRVPIDFTIKKKEAEEYFAIDKFQSSNPNALTQLYLLALKRDRTSKWTPYLDILATFNEIHSPLLWKDQELNLIRGSDLYTKTKRKLVLLLDEWFNLLTELDMCTESVTKFYESQDRNNISVEESYSIDSFGAYVWASLIFSSRAFPSILYDTTAPLNEAFLLPIVDLLNHKPSADVKWKEEAAFITFSSSESLKAEDELFNNYGDKSNEELLLSYGFSYEGNPHDCTSISLKIDGISIEKARSCGIRLNHDNIVGDTIRFDIPGNDPLPRELVLFFGFISKLNSEKDITVRAVLEGLGQLRAIFAQKVAIFKEKLKMLPNAIQNATVKKNTSIYLNSQRKLYQSSEEEVNKKIKAIIKTYKPISFKSMYKSDTAFANSLLLSMGVSSYEELARKNVTHHALLLWIVKAHNSSFYKGEKPPEFVKAMFEEVKSSIKIDKEDVLEYMSFYKTFFPALSKSIPEIYNVGSWSISDFVIAGVVIDRLVWLRETSNEYLIFKKTKFDMQVLC